MSRELNEWNCNEKRIFGRNSKEDQRREKDLIVRKLDCLRYFVNENEFDEERFYR